jgi:DNA-binding NarL/FixJ family response regulator
MPIHILIPDDHGFVRQGLPINLQFDPELEIVGEASNEKEELEQAGKLRPDIVLMDILMPVMDRLEAPVAIRRAMPDTEVIVLTSVLDDTIIHHAIRA